MHLLTRNLHTVYFAEDRSVHSNTWGQELVLKPGEKTHIVAPSGSGTTSFIHCLYGLRKEYNGSIHYNGSDIRALTADQVAVYRQKHISIVFQDLRLFPDETVAQNIEIKRQLQPYHPASKIEEFAGRLGVAHKLNML